MPDVFATLPLRFCGYGFAFGECAKYNFTFRTVDLLNCMGGVYIVCHAAKNGWDARNDNPLLRILDTLIFDGIASCIIPCFMCYHACRLTANLLSELDTLPRFIYKWGPFVVGVTLLLILSKNIDELVNKILDETLRTLY
ncbi:uncharacterized protein LOC106050108 [Biomphalaria glabrata]|uniref:Mitochondrial fission process protein 1 n=1 Tax=Biomphalaria glabrata TaxID=6526 RepID=A0A9W2YG40_BIOGL|nr:uncharacterized protein LOC106050108 [Biomphalaria glabrata]KAI8740006.1 mitochondrial fission process protein 1 [Biomphalaria glabrata]